MPLLYIETNVDEKKFTEELLKRLSSTLASLIGKPEKYIAVSVRGNQLMTFSGSMEPTALCSLTSIGCINEEKNSSYSEAIFGFLAEVGVPSDRAYIAYHDIARENIAWNGKLFSK